ncbi:hypothetical protein, partial [Nostoc sp.]|uniref:hypothetical protein n=1 Tax=Nostoc sp. TaxID=1180 RepID=UPI002FF99798
SLPPPNRAKRSSSSSGPHEWICSISFPPSLESVDELKSLLDKLLNQGELVIKWHRKIKNKGNSSYVAI